MKRNHIGWRKAHYARISARDQSYVLTFLDQLAEAIVRVGWKNFYNFDESNVRVFNSNTITIARKGAEEVIVDSRRNDREYFTTIGDQHRRNFAINYFA